MAFECPKCGRKEAWLEQDGPDIIMRCWCGLWRVVQTRLEKIKITHSQPQESVRLPKRDSKLYRTLAVLYTVEPASTAYVTDMLVMGREDPLEVLTVSDVASQLTVLKYRGLVEVLANRKGVAGGSTWRMTVAAKQIFERGA